MPSAKIVGVERSNSGSYPIIVNFQNGSLKRRKLTGHSETGIFHSVNGKKTIQLAVEEGMEYCGSEEEAQGRTFLAIKKGRTGMIRMMQVGKVNLQHSSLATKREKVVDEKDYMAKSSDLQRTFGGKKAVRKMEKADKFRLNAATNDLSLETTIAEMPVAQEAHSTSKQISDSILNFLPPSNRETKVASEVYQLDELVTQHVLISILEDLSISNDAPSSENWFPFTKSLLGEKKLSDIPAEKLATFLYLESLIAFINMKSADFRRKYTKLSAFDAVHKKFSDDFCQRDDKGAITRSLMQRDKAIAYALAISFILGDLNISLTPLTKDIGISLKKAVELCRALGGTPKGKGSSDYVLKMPLPALPTSSGGNRKSVKK